MSSDIPRGVGRRQFIAIGVGAFVVGALPLAARRNERLVRRTMPVMGTLAELAVLDADPRHAHVAMDAAMRELRWVEQTMSRFRPASDIGRANLGAMRDGVLVAPETAFVVGEALAWAEASEGAYDPAVGGLVALWDVTHRHEPPSHDAVARLAGRRLHRAVETGRRGAQHVLRFHDADAALDLGAIAKGYAVDRAAGAMRALGVRHALVNVGGDLVAIGTGPSGDAWRVGIQDPDDARAVLATVDVADGAIATSGTYQQFFRWRGRRFHHLLDPETAAPRETPVRSLTVKADRCLHADVAATALYGMPPARAAALLARRAPGAEIVRTA